MKTNLTLAFFLLVAIGTFGQKKADLEMEIDSLNKATQTLNMQVDSLTKEVEAYRGVYNTVSNKVIKYNFEPTRMGELIDSLRTGNDSTFSATNITWQDSVNVLLEQIEALKSAESASLLEEGDKDKMVEELHTLKGLLDEKIITQGEFDERKAKVLDGW